MKALWDFATSRLGIAVLAVIAVALVAGAQQYRVNSLRVKLATAVAAQTVAEANETVVRDAVEDQNEAVQEFAGQCRAEEYAAQVRALQTALAAEKERDRIKERPAKDAAELNAWLTDTFSH